MTFVRVAMSLAFPTLLCDSHSHSHRTSADQPVTSPMPLYTGFIQLGAGLSVGLAGLAAGFAIGIVGDAGVRGTAQQPRLFVGMVSLVSALSLSLLSPTYLRVDQSTTRFLSLTRPDSYPHFRRSARSVRSHCSLDPQHQGWNRLHCESRSP